MISFTTYTIAAALLVSFGLHGALTQRHLVRRILALNVVGGGVFLFLVALAARGDNNAPDPVPHALVLTGIVVTVSITAFGVALARRIHAQTGSTHLSEEDLE